VIGIGPQLGFIFPVGDMQGYLNLKATRNLPPSIALMAGTLG
jgi:hypothetical protein